MSKKMVSSIVSTPTRVYSRESEHEVVALKDSTNITSQINMATKKFIESDAGDGTQREDQYVHGMKLVLCMVSLLLCLFLVALDMLIVGTILPVVGNQFHAFEKVGWLSSGFMVASAVFIQPFAKLSIITGRRYAMVVGIIIFEAGSLMSALAPNMNVLIGGRVLAGVGAAGCQGLVFVIVAEILPIHRRPLGMTTVTIVFAIASVLGPVLGGVFTSKATWRWAFYVNLPIGGVAAVLFMFTFKPPFPKGSIKAKLMTYDYVGTVLLISGLVLFLLALSFGGNEFKWDSAAVIVCFILGFILSVAFWIWDFKFTKNPLIPYEIIKIPQILAAYAAASGNYASLMLTTIYLITYFQIIFDKSALSSSLHVLPMIIAMIASAAVSGILVQKTKHLKIFSLTGGILGPIGGGLLCLLDIDTAPNKQRGLLVISGISVGCQMQSAMIGAQLSAPKTPGSTILATSLVNFFRSIISAIAVILGGTVYSASLQNKYTAAIKKETDPSILAQFAGMDGKTVTASNEFVKNLSPDAQIFIKKILMSAILNTFYLALAFTAISLVGSFFVTNKKIPPDEAVEVKKHDEESGIGGDESNIEEAVEKSDS